MAFGFVFRNVVDVGASVDDWLSWLFWRILHDWLTGLGWIGDWHWLTCLSWVGDWDWISLVDLWLGCVDLLIG